MMDIDLRGQAVLEVFPTERKLMVISEKDGPFFIHSTQFEHTFN